MSYVVYCDDVAMLTFSRQTLAVEADAQNAHRLMAESNRLRARIRELEESLAGMLNEELQRRRPRL